MSGMSSKSRKMNSSLLSTSANSINDGGTSFATAPDFAGAGFAPLKSNNSYAFDRSFERAQSIFELSHDVVLETADITSRPLPENVYMHSLKFTAIILYSACFISGVCCMLGFAYSYLPWTTGKKNSDYFNEWVLLYFDDVPRSLILTIVAALQINLVFPLLSFRAYVLPWTLTVALTGIIVFLIMDNVNFEIWFYGWDVYIFVLLFAFSTLVSGLQTYIWKYTTKLKALLWLILCLNISAILIGLVDGVILRKYIVASPLQRIVWRVVLFPIMVDLSLYGTEYLARKVVSNSVYGIAQCILTLVLAFSLLGRFLVIASGSLWETIIMTVLSTVKDCTLHRLTRQQFRILVFCRKTIFSLCCYPDEDFTEEKVYDNHHFQIYRGVIITTELLIELCTSIYIPFFIITFHRHSLLFNFAYENFEDDGHFLIGTVLLNAFIQFLGVLTSVWGISIIELNVNSLDLLEVFRSKAWKQRICEFLNLVWGIYFLLGLVRQMPNSKICTANDICSCAELKKSFDCE